MLREVIVSLAAMTPVRLKSWIHRHEVLDRLARGGFSKLMRLHGRTVRIAEGPLKGLSLVLTNNISHAHIRGTYEIEVASGLDAVIRPGAICYDLGASIGYFTILLARKAGHVFAFEPAPHAVRDLQRQIDANRFENVTVVPTPVSDSVKTVEFSLTPSACGSRIVEGECRWRTLRMQTITLDEFVRSHPAPDLMKIDVEDEEDRVLAGARQILREKRPVICCEIHSERAAHQVHSILLDHGYRLNLMNGKEYRLEGPVIPGELQIMATPA